MFTFRFREITMHLHLETLKLLEAMACSSGTSSTRFEQDVGDLRVWSFDGQESSLGDESGERNEG